MTLWFVSKVYMHIKVLYFLTTTLIPFFFFYSSSFSMLSVKLFSVNKQRNVLHLLTLPSQKHHKISNQKHRNSPGIAIIILSDAVGFITLTICPWGEKQEVIKTNQRPEMVYQSLKFIFILHYNFLLQRVNT